MTVVSWIDEFAVDHFTDRYLVRAGVDGGSFSVTPDGLAVTAAAWSDPTNRLGDFDLVVVEMDFVSWAILLASNLFIGFQPLGAALPAALGAGVCLNLAGGGALQLRSGAADIGHYFGDLGPLPSDALLTMRLTIDRLGMVMYGIAANLDSGGLFVGDAVAKSIGGYGRLTPEALAGLADCVPVAEVGVSGGGFVTRWAYWIFGASSTPGEVQALPVAGGIVKSEPIPLGSR